MMASKQRPLLDFFGFVAIQLLMAAMLAPGDGGHWLRFTAANLAILDIVLYFAFGSGGRPLPRLLSLGGLCFVVGSFAVASIGMFWL